eukprot:437120-Rhodomonas_salina.2
MHGLQEVIGLRAQEAKSTVQRLRGGRNRCNDCGGHRSVSTTGEEQKDMAVRCELEAAIVGR